MSTSALPATFTTSRAEAFRGDAVARIVQNAVSAQGADEVSLDRDIINRLDDSTSERLDTWAVTSQKKSGRCWNFSGLNVLRAKMINELGLEDFAFSQNFVAFHDKLEKANHTLAKAIETADLPLQDEKVRRILDNAGDDGGYWFQFVDLVTKYGLVPVWAMPDTESAGNTDQMNRALSAVLRKAVGRIRNAVPEDRDAIRTATLEDVWRILAIHLGTPPSSFTWQYRDKEKNFHAEGVVTPLEFAQRYLPEDFADYVVLAHDPREEHPVGEAYVVDNLPFMEGGSPYVHISVSLDEMKRAAIASIRDGEPVWFACDVAQQFARKEGIWSAHLHDYDSLYGVDYSMPKADRMRMRDTNATHIMVFVGVDLDEDGNAKRWRVENSWGDEVGKKGFFTMNDDWFDEYVFQVAVSPTRLSPGVIDALDREWIVLPEWDALM